MEEGSVADVDLVLASLKKNGGNINGRNIFGLTPLHIAVWRNHIPIVKRLLTSGADPNARDGESGWSSLHRALHFGHLAVASALIQSGASTTLEDSKSRTPVDLLSGPVLQSVGNGDNSVTTEVFSWGSGVNYQLGTGNAHIQKLPCKVDSLHGSFIKLISAAKFHSVAVTARGEVYTWGFGRGGRLGHPDFDIHSGQAAVITPRLVTSGLGARRVKAIAAAKHHTVVATEGGEVFTWGSNREGQLGYTSVDTQPTPRRGQLGYGTSNSASNYTPRVVECLKGKVFEGVATAKYHTIVLGADGEVFTWGHRLVTPKRERYTAWLSPMTVHCFYWVSSDPDLRCQQVYLLCGRAIVSVSAGKYWTGAVTATGDVYMWDGKNGKGELPICNTATRCQEGNFEAQADCVTRELDELEEDFMFNDMESDKILSPMQKDDMGNRSIPTLKSICEKVAAEFLVEPRNALQLLEIADSLGADNLRKHCEDIAIRNLDYIITVSAHAVTSASLEILVNLEKFLDLRSSEPWSYRRLPTPTATFPAIINSEEEDSESELQTRDSHTKKATSKKDRDHRLDCFLQPNNYANEEICKQVRALRKKLQQIEMLEEKQSKGHNLDDQQIAKLQTRSTLEYSLTDLGVPIETMQAKVSSSVFLNGKGNKKAEVSKKQRRKSKQKVSQVAEESVSSAGGLELNPMKDFLDVQISQAEHKDEIVEVERIVANQVSKESPFCVKKGFDDTPLDKGSLPKASKKKNKKGGLSMFLSGALDEIPKKDSAPPPPLTPKSEGPAWGGAKIAKESTSLREIQDEQSKTKGSRSTRSKDQVEDVFDSKSDGKIHLHSFLPSNPIPVVSARTSQVSDGERNTPPWAASGTPPSNTLPSLRDIQMQQGKHHQSLSHSPKTRTTGFSIATVQGSPSDSASLNRWFKTGVRLQVKGNHIGDFRMRPVILSETGHSCDGPIESPLGEIQQEMLRATAVKIVAGQLARSEPPFRHEVVMYMLDADSHAFSIGSGPCGGDCLHGQMGERHACVEEPYLYDTRARIAGDAGVVPRSDCPHIGLLRIRRRGVEL
ncbi:ankyrin repeat family protein [Actinidia rufa]|uniref:Ankyrin repeat family protein n=1 Tax=Actinidia rufa TaxID=165716 RepID=A0A7J0FH54_9ERIC|nr:ankyrin repeat family protein [Actinidia rufa]